MSHADRNITGTPEVLAVPARRARLHESWILLRRNRLALAGMVIFLLFFVVAVAGMFLTTGTSPALDPNLVRLQEQLRPPLSRANLDSLGPEEVPKTGLYLLGTDELGRDVFARMLQGAWVSLTVGFVAVGISVAIGIFMGGLAGFYGQRHIRLEQLLVTAVLLTGAGLLATGPRSWGAGVLIIGHAWLFWSISPWGLQRRKALPAGLGFLRKNTLMVDTLIMRFVDIMLCF